MSSEGAESVVGSEVMPLDYGSMDAESSPSPTSSEKTVEGVRGDEGVEVGEREVVEVGRDEVVGVRVDSIPITVVEVEVRPAGVEERACSAPRDHWMPVYSHYLIAGLRFPLPELLIGLLLDYNIGLTQLVPNAMRGGSRRDKGWYYFTPRVAKKESRVLFTVGPSSIKGWKEKLFFVDNTEWGKGDTEVRELASWKAKRANQNRFSLNEDEEEEVRKLVRKGGDVLNIMDLTSAACIEVAELYGPSTLSEAEMDQFLNTVGGAPIPKKPRKKSKTSTKQVDERRAGKEMVPLASAETEEEVLSLKRKGWEERKALQKKQKVVEEDEGVEVPEFVPQPSPVELDLELRQLEEGAEVRALGKGKGPIPPLGPQSSLFEAKNITGARWFINNTFPEVDQSNVRQEALRYGGASVVKHVLESVSWVNGLAQEFRESLKDRALLQRQRDQLQKEKEVLEKKNKELQESLNEVVPTVSQLEQERSSLSTKLAFEESKRRIAESEREAQAQEMKLMTEAFKELKGNMRKLVHNGMKEHISNFISSSSFDSIVNLYQLPTAIIAFTDCRNKVKAEYPEVDVTKITFGEQEEGVEENGESMSADFLEEEGAEVEEGEMEAGVEGTEVGKVQPAPEVEIHPVLSDDE
ncbi:hypothetical protein SLEP1_g15196 [Rubroshorea leprosula]|uniref:Transposase (Putative), gypsy type n=1 Tax=Rubroshorea leprosula TaxID=152421 RepID=A0AAV5IVG6_9ROSI|nr:hypothetical protein SLEP1_g15196 [Rubroshorea leprosula]